VSHALVLPSVERGLLRRGGVETERARRRKRGVAIDSNLADFVIRHHACGQLTGDATEPAPGGYLVGVTCSCGGVFMRWVTPEWADTVVRIKRCQAECASTGPADRSTLAPSP
jgi:hypothetical protein